jgi:hypothetical protein
MGRVREGVFRGERRARDIAPDIERERERERERDE